MSSAVRRVSPTARRVPLFSRRLNPINKRPSRVAGTSRPSPTGLRAITQFSAKLGLSKAGKEGLLKNLTELLLPGVADNPEKTEQVMQVARRIADSGNTTALAVFRNLIEMSVSNDIFEAVAEWEPIGYYEAPPAKDGRPRHSPVRGTLYGAPLCDFYTLRNTRDSSKTIQVGDILFRRLVAEFRDWGKPKADQMLSAEARKKRREEKQTQMDELLRSPRETLEDVFRDPKGRAELAKIDALEMLDAEIREAITKLDRLAETSREITDSRDHSGVIEDYSEHLVSLEPNRGFMTWFGEQLKANRLPKSIASIYMKAKDDVLGLEPWEASALFIYAAKNRKVMRKAVVGSVEADLKLLASLPEDSPIVQKYGKTDLTSISDLLGKKAITLLDATRILDARPDILQIRVELNTEATRIFSEDIIGVIEKVRPIFMTDQFLWHQEFRQGRSEERTGRTLYAKTLNVHDYTQIKKLLKRVTIGAGTMMDNFTRGYSIAEFRGTVEDLVVLGRRLQLVENLAQKHKIQVPNVYEVEPAVLAEIPAADIFNIRVRDKEGQLVYHPVEHFENHPANTTKLGLQDLIDMTEAVSVPQKGNFHFLNFRTKHLPRIKALAEVGLFHQDDLGNLVHYYNHPVSRHFRPGGTEQLSTWDRVIQGAQGNPLVEFVGELPERGLRYYTNGQYRAIEYAGKALETFHALLKQNGGPGPHNQRLAYLRGVAENATIFDGKLGPYRYNLHETSLDMESLTSTGIGGSVRYNDPQKVMDRYTRFIGSHVTLASLIKKDPSFGERIKKITERADLRDEYARRGFDVPEELLTSLRQMTEAPDPSRVFISNGAIETIRIIYSLLDDIEAREKNLDNVLTPGSLNIPTQAAASGRRLVVNAIGSEFSDRDALQGILPRFNRTGRVWSAYAVTPEALPGIQRQVIAFNRASGRQIRLLVELDQDSQERYQKPEDVISSDGLGFNEVGDGTFQVVAANARPGYDRHYLRDRRGDLGRIGFVYNPQRKAWIWTGTKQGLLTAMEKVRSVNTTHNEQIELVVLNSQRYNTYFGLGGEVDTSVLTPAAKAKFEGLSDKEGQTFTVFIPRSTHTFRQKEFLQRNLHMRWVDSGYVLEGVTLAQLAEITSAIAEKNQSNSSSLTVDLK